MNPWRGLKDLPKSMWLLFATTLINRSGTMVLPFLALYLTQKVGITPERAGFVLAFYGLGALVTSPLIGRLSDKVGSLRIMKLSLILSGLTMFAYSYTTDFTMIVVLTFVLSVISEAFRPANLSLISDIVDSSMRRPAFALNRLAINAGMSVGPVAGGFLALMNFHYIFYVDGVTSIISGIFLILTSQKYFGEHEVHKKKLVKETVEKVRENIFTDSRFLYFMLALLPVPMIYMQHQSSMPVFLVRDLHFSAATYGILFMINTVMIIFIEVPLNNLLNHWTERKILSIGALLCGIGFGGMAFAKDIYGISLTIVIWTFGEMIIFPASSAYMSEIAPVNRRGEYMGIYQTIFNLAFTFGPWVGTAVLENYGSSVLWIGALISGLISSLMMLGIKQKRLPAE